MQLVFKCKTHPEGAIDYEADHPSLEELDSETMTVVVPDDMYCTEAEVDPDDGSVAEDDKCEWEITAEA